MKQLLFLFFTLISLRSGAQNFLPAEVVTSLGENQYYFIGQSHNNKANTVIEYELLVALNKKYGVRYDILEYSHSAAFLINEYLETGKDSLLTCINTEAHFNFIKSIKVYNDNLDDDKKIRFYGIDFEGRENGKYTRKALEIILQQTKLAEKHPLYLLLHNIVNSESDSLDLNIIKLKTYILKNDQDSRMMLSRYFIDVWLIANAQYGFSPKRDKYMFANFRQLYNELSINGETPKFFSSFGIGHINPHNTNGIALRLLQDKDSPVKDKVSLIGIQYYNCLFKGKIGKTSEGTLNFLCKNSITRKLAEQDNKESKISFLTKKDLNNLGCDKFIKELSGLILVRNFGVSTYWMWE